MHVCVCNFAHKAEFLCIVQYPVLMLTVFGAIFPYWQL